MESVKNQIKTWKESLLAPNKNDVLLNLIPEKNALNVSEVYHEESIFIIEENSLVKRLFSQHQKHIKETGSPIFGIATNLIQFEIDAVSYAMPFLLASAEIKRNRYNARYEVQQTEDFYINPLLLKTLKINELPKEIEKTIEVLENQGLKAQAETGVWIANFHPHRFVLQMEFDELLNVENYSNSLKGLLGKTSEKTELVLANSFLFSADESQIQAIKTAENQDIVIQGPPGTGKSQVIANLIGKTIGINKSAMLVAEKSVALQVIYDKLKDKDLHHFCVLYHHELHSKQFVNSLKNTWMFLEELDSTPISINEQSRFILQNIDLTLNRLRQSDLVGGTTFSKFKNLFDVSKTGKYIIQKPSVNNWLKEKEIILDLLEDDFPVFGALVKVKTQHFSIETINENLNKVLELFKDNISEDLSLNELENKLKLSNYLSLFYYNSSPLPIEVFQSKEKLHKTFSKRFNTLKTLLEKEDLLKKEEENWGKKFSLSELEEYIAALTSTKISYSAWKTKKHLLKFTDLNMVDGVKALENLKELYQVQKDIIKVKEQLRKDKLPDELTVLEHINYTNQRLQAADNNDLKKLFNLTKDERNEIYKSAGIWQQINNLLKTYFNLDESESILEQLKEIQKITPKLAENSARVESLTSDTIYAISKTKSLEDLEEAIYYSHWADFKGKFPNLAAIDGKDIVERIENSINAFDKELEEFALHIQQGIKRKFDDYHVLLQTPARRLSDEEKILKKELRRGKSILVKAFDRKRAFPTVRELLESEAKHWIQLLHPVFLCSPYSVAKSIPFSTTFDLVIFDEASQIPLGHVVGSVQRARRAVICGDQQQMAPTFYFQKKDYQQSDVLHHASFYWENVMLTHHYRSLNSQLIAFSNQYFYENKLRTFPLPKMEEAIECINLNGVFEERKNDMEAEKAAEIISEKIKKKEFDFGLVAFSQTQLENILQRIPAEELIQLEGKDDIFMQSLENVQGDQCKHLIISLGYAKDENGDFHMRFGPLNQEQGYRRLNVLMSRAIEKITFIRSVNSKDFPISDNEGVELLRKLMIFLEREQKPTDLYNFQKGIERNDNTLIINDVANVFNTGQEAADFYRTFTGRGWTVKINV